MTKPWADHSQKWGSSGTSLTVQWLGLHASTAGGEGWSLVRELRSRMPALPGQNKNKKNKKEMGAVLPPRELWPASLDPKYPTVCCLPQEYPPFGCWKHWGLQDSLVRIHIEVWHFPKYLPYRLAESRNFTGNHIFLLKVLFKGSSRLPGMNGFQTSLGHLGHLRQRDSDPVSCERWTQGTLTAPSPACPGLRAPRAMAECEVRHTGALVLASFFYSTSKAVKTAPE